MVGRGDVISCELAFLTDLLLICVAVGTLLVWLLAGLLWGNSDPCICHWSLVQITEVTCEVLAVNSHLIVGRIAWGRRVKFGSLLSPCSVFGVTVLSEQVERQILCTCVSTG